MNLTVKKLQTTSIYKLVFLEGLIKLIYIL